MIEVYGWLVWYPIYGLSQGHFVGGFVGIVYVTLGHDNQECHLLTKQLLVWMSVCVFHRIDM